MWKYKTIQKTNVHEFLLHLCHRIDKMKLKENIIKNAGTTNRIEL